ncbi:mechanosensitive ion channel protein 5-like [Magnolia sinica]|uniref:mechanosensitive ion channel protein 5-like n=1 Tax=Magnolia sinica TaxID=86752 RepID=UPI002658880D|nr:mechanosensitive ion channel protein 5-like [Magnolia sinica]
MDEAENSVPIQVVLRVDPQSSTPKQSSEIIPQLISEDHNHLSVFEPEDEHIKEDSEAEDEEEDHHKCKIKLRVITKWAAFIVITACLISTFTIPSLIHKTLWGLELWKWCLTILVVFSGRIFSGWLVSFSVFIFRLSFMLHHKFAYVDSDLLMGVQNCVWLGLVFLIWKLMVTPDVEVPSRSHRLLSKVTRALIVVLVGSIIWVVKIVVMKMATTLFHFSRFFDRIREHIVHLYIIYTLLGSSRRKINRSWWRKRIGIDPKDLTKLSRKNLSWWNANRLVLYIKWAWLSRISKTDDETWSEDTDDRQAKAAARKIFKNVAKAGAR